MNRSGKPFAVRGEYVELPSKLALAFGRLRPNDFFVNVMPERSLVLSQLASLNMTFLRECHITFIFLG